jgi:exopolyphosphatase/guanosine-5'-triphosphate,3'-diphosphate pyrophosphatase
LIALAIDLGSNSIRALKVDCNTKETLGTFHKTVRTADGLNRTKKISQEALKRVIDALKEADKKLDFKSAKIKAVTTEALRQALNSKEILEEIKRETGVEFEIINGDDEAKYALTATKHRLQKLNINPKSFVLVDIGGASTEVIFSYPKKAIFKSFSIGIVTLTQKFSSLEEIRENISKEVEDIKRFVQDTYKKHGRVEEFIAIAGTPTTIASLKLGFTYKTYNPEKIHGTALSMKDLDIQLKKLLSMSKDEKIEAVGVGREDLIASGVLIFKELYKILDFQKSIVIDDGIREGVAYNLCK